MARLPATHLCEWRRVRAGLLLPYHLGRLTTYALLGGLAAGSAQALRPAVWFATGSAMLLGVAASLFLMHALRLMVPSFGRRDGARARLFAGRLATNRLVRGLTRVTRRLPRGFNDGVH